MRKYLVWAAILGLTATPGCTVPVAGGNGNGSGANTDGGGGNGNADDIPLFTQFGASLSGDAEVPPLETAMSGRANLNLSEDGDAISFRISIFSGVGVSQAHIHLGGADENGQVVVSLYAAPDGSMDFVDGETISGRITAADLQGALAGMTITDLVREMSAGGAYVNVHTVANPGGEIRGQIAGS